MSVCFLFFLLVSAFLHFVCCLSLLVLYVEYCIICVSVCVCVCVCVSVFGLSCVNSVVESCTSCLIPRCFLVILPVSFLRVNLGRHRRGARTRRIRRKEHESPRNAQKHQHWRHQHKSAKLTLLQIAAARWLPRPADVHQCLLWCNLFTKTSRHKVFIQHIRVLKVLREAKDFLYHVFPF